jgi:hypothetical protein
MIAKRLESHQSMCADIDQLFKRNPNAQQCEFESYGGVPLQLMPTPTFKARRGARGVQIDGLNANCCTMTIATIRPDYVESK